MSKLPETLKEAVDEVLRRIEKANQLGEFSDLTEENLVMLHHSLGRKVRNEFGLWEGNEKLMRSIGETHADDASGVIIKAAWIEAKAKGCVIIDEKEN